VGYQGVWRALTWSGVFEGRAFTGKKMEGKLLFEAGAWEGYGRYTAMLNALLADSEAVGNCQRHTQLLRASNKQTAWDVMKDHQKVDGMP
jgi:hypothetical protein